MGKSKSNRKSDSKVNNTLLLISFIQITSKWDISKYKTAYISPKLFIMFVNK